MTYTFTIPDLPQSVNSLYKINYGHRVVYLSPQGRMYKNKVKLHMPPMEFPPNAFFEVTLRFFGEWFFKNGKVKRIDVQNLIKILLDALFERIGVDDSRIFGLAAFKEQSEEKKVEVRIEGT